MNTAERLLADALQLDQVERASLALDLMDSLSLPDLRDEAGWIEEVERRALRALDGGSPSVGADETIDRIWRDLEL